MATSVYQNKNSVEIYDRTHGFTTIDNKYIAKFEKFRDETASSFAKIVRRCSDDKDYINILDVGAGHGDFFLLPLIEALANYKTMHAVCMDNSREMEDEFKKRIALRPTIQSLLQSEDWEYNYIMKDIDSMWLNDEKPTDWINKNSLKDERFDIILITALLNHTMNWRLILEFVLENLLSNDGYIILSERNGVDSNILDGNFSLIGNSEKKPHENWKAIWQCYYAERKRIGRPWEPEISISDYGAVISFLKSRGLTIALDKNANWEISYQKKEIFSWLEEPVFSNFQRSLTDDEINELVKAVSKKISNNEYPIHEGWRIIALRRT